MPGVVNPQRFGGGGLEWFIHLSRQHKVKKKIKKIFKLLNK